MGPGCGGGVGQDSGRIAAQIDASLSPQQKKQLSAGTPLNWADETSRWRIGKSTPGCRVMAGSVCRRIMPFEKAAWRGCSWLGLDCAWGLCSTAFSASRSLGVHTLTQRCPSDRALLAFHAAAGFNLRVQPTGSDNFAEKFFSPVRFGIFLALLVFAAFPQVAAWTANLCHPRLWIFRVSPRPLPARLFSGTAKFRFGILIITAACHFWRSGTPCRSTRRR